MIPAVLGAVAANQSSLFPNANLQYWFDASDATTITLNGSTVSGWADKSGNARNLAQSTSSYQPTYVASGQNGKNLVRFDGTDDRMQLASTVTVSALNTKWDIYVAGKPTSASVMGRTFVSMGVDAGAPAGGLPLIQLATNSTIHYESGSGVGSINTSATYLNAAKVYRASYSSTDGVHQLYVNNVSAGTATNSNARMNQPMNFYMGSVSSGYYWFYGDMYEVLVFSERLNTADSAAVTSYLTTKWGL